jgi:hypothetical protein
MEAVIEVADWAAPVDRQLAATRVAQLEEGKIMTASDAAFELTSEEQRFRSPEWLDGKAKNISFDPATGDVRGTSATGKNLDDLQRMMRRFSARARELMIGLCPSYRDVLEVGRASFRPAQVAARVSSWRKDDTRLHVDAFPSRPLQGRRIIRLFVNAGVDVRRWRTGEPFEQVAQTFLSRIGRPLPGSLWLLEHLHITRGRRTLYDHFMLGLHDAIKADQQYQADARHTEVLFPPGATWACYTDCVSHAALSGQFALEQTLYLPVNAMQDPSRSPLRILERLLGRKLT